MMKSAYVFAKRKCYLLVISFVFLFPSSCLADESLKITTSWGTCPSEVIERDSKHSLIVGVVAPLVVGIAAQAAVEYAIIQYTNILNKQEFTTTDEITSNFYFINKLGDLYLYENNKCLTVTKGDDSNPSLVFTVQMKPTPDGKGYRFIPVSLKFSKPEKATWYSKNTRNFTFSITLTNPKTLVPIGSAVFTFNSLKPGVDLKPDDAKLKYLSGPVFASPDLSDAIKERAARQKFYAPSILAYNIVTGKIHETTHVVGGMPNPYQDPKVISELKSYCDELLKSSSDVFKSDDRCSYTIKEKNDNLSKAVDAFYNEPSVVQWAKQLCGNDDLTEGLVHCIPTPDNPAYTQIPTKIGEFSTKVIVVETRESTDSAKAIGTALGANKGEIVNAIKNVVLPYDRAQLNAGMKIADLKVENAQFALSKAIAANPQDAGAIMKARLDLATAKKDANEAYRKSGESVPFSEVD